MKNIFKNPYSFYRNKTVFMTKKTFSYVFKLRNIFIHKRFIGILYFLKKDLKLVLKYA